MSSSLSLQSSYCPQNWGSQELVLSNFNLCFSTNFKWSRTKSMYAYGVNLQFSLKRKEQQQQLENAPVGVGFKLPFPTPKYLTITRN
jgi:hypothetical protein